MIVVDLDDAPIVPVSIEAHRRIAPILYRVAYEDADRCLGWLRAIVAARRAENREHERSIRHEVWSAVAPLIADECGGFDALGGLVAVASAVDYEITRSVRELLSREEAS